MREAKNIAWFITPHGFGHGTRAIAIMAALRERLPEIHFEIFTLFPQWLLDQSLAGSYNYHELESDLGMVQRSALEIDFPRTLQRLREFLPFNQELVTRQARIVKEQGCQLVVCDIAPLGVAVAQAAQLPSVMVENFTWHWIYEAYLDLAPDLAPFIELLQDYDQRASFRIQTEPVGVYRPGALVTQPVVRKIRKLPLQTRQELAIDPNKKMVVITMGGLGHQPEYLDRLRQFHNCIFLMPGQSSRPECNLLGLEFSDRVYHPDLINAADLVIGKLGYSTFAEVWQAGVPFGFVERERFRESPAIASYIQKHMPGHRYTEADLVSGGWVDHLEALLRLERREPPRVNGADQAAEYLLKLTLNQ